MDKNTPIIKIRNFTKKYGDHIAVDNISFDIFPGEIFGFGCAFIVPDIRQSGDISDDQHVCHDAHDISVKSLSAHYSSAPHPAPHSLHQSPYIPHCRL